MRVRTIRYQRLTVEGLRWFQVMRDSVSGQIFAIRVRRLVVYRRHG